MDKMSKEPGSSIHTCLRALSKTSDEVCCNKLTDAMKLNAVYMPTGYESKDHHARS